MLNSDIYYIQDEEPSGWNFTDFWDNYYLRICEVICMIILLYNILAYTWCEIYCGFYIFNSIMVVIYIFIYFILKILSNDFNDILSRDEYRRSVIILIILFLYFLMIDILLIYFGLSDSNKKIKKLNILDEYIFISIFSKMLITVFYIYISNRNRINSINISFYSISRDNMNL